MVVPRRHNQYAVVIDHIDRVLIDAPEEFSGEHVMG